MRSETKPASEAHDDPLAGTPFRNLGEIGAGGMSIVYEAEDAASGQRVVVKVLRDERAGEAQLVERFRREIELLVVSLRHPHIVRCLGFGSTAQGRLYFVMERLHGATLADELLERGGLPVREVVRFGRQVLSALGAALERGVTHRDLKPANLFVHRGLEAPLPPEPVVVVLDFGFARIKQGLSDGSLSRERHRETTGRGIAIGTPRYMAPEVACGGEADHRSDLYSFGWVLWAMLTGRQPFDDLLEDRELLAAQVLRDAERPSSFSLDPVPPELDDFVLRLLAKNPSERFQSWELADAALAAIEQREIEKPNAPVNEDPSADARALPDIADRQRHAPRPTRPAVSGRVLWFLLTFAVSAGLWWWGLPRFLQ